jgi:hypothetical protein
MEEDRVGCCVFIGGGGGEEGLTELPGVKVRYASPKITEQTLKIAVSKFEAEKQTFNASLTLGLG